MDRVLVAWPAEHDPHTTEPRSAPEGSARMCRARLERRAASQPQHKVDGALLLDVVVTYGLAVVELLAAEDQALLLRRDARLVLDLGLDVGDRVGLLHIHRLRLAGQRLDEKLLAAAPHPQKS